MATDAQIQKDRVKLLKSAIKKSKLNHTMFAELLCVDVRTVRRWLEGTRKIEGPTTVLLVLIEQDPQAVMMELGFAW